MNPSFLKGVGAVLRTARLLTLCCHARGFNREYGFKVLLRGVYIAGSLVSVMEKQLFQLQGNWIRKGGNITLILTFSLEGEGNWNKYRWIKIPSALASMWERVGVNAVELRRRHRFMDVAPVKTGVQSSIENAERLDSGLRRNDGVKRSGSSCAYFNSIEGAGEGV